MDPSGVPHKINRHVFKAIGHYMHQKNGSTFTQILNYVKLCNRNLKPVTNLREYVRRSLENFQRAGVIHKDDTNHFRIRCPIIVSEMGKMSANKDSTQPYLPSKSRKRKYSDSSFENESEPTTSKRFRSRKKTMTDRKGAKVDLPRARKSRSKPEPKGKARVPTKIDLRKVAEHRKTQKGLNFDDCSTGEPGADDRDSGDESYIHSAQSLGQTNENGQLADNVSEQSQAFDEAVLNANVFQDNITGMDDNASKLNFAAFD